MRSVLPNTAAAPDASGLGPRLTASNLLDRFLVVTAELAASSALELISVAPSPNLQSHADGIRVRLTKQRVSPPICSWCS